MDWSGIKDTEVIQTVEECDGQPCNVRSRQVIAAVALAGVPLAAAAAALTRGRRRPPGWFQKIYVLVPPAHPSSSITNVLKPPLTLYGRDRSQPKIKPEVRN